MQRADFFELAKDNHEDEEGRTEQASFDLVHSINEISRIFKNWGYMKPYLSLI